MYWLLAYRVAILPVLMIVSGFCSAQAAENNVPLNRTLVCRGLTPQLCWYPFYSWVVRGHLGEEPYSRAHGPAARG